MKRRLWIAAMSLFALTVMGAPPAAHADIPPGCYLVGSKCTNDDLCCSKSCISDGSNDSKRKCE